MTPRMTLETNDRTLAVLAHLSGLAGYVSFGFGLIVPLVMWLSLSDRPVLATIAKQALFLNLAVLAVGFGAFLMWFTIVLIPLAWVIGAILTPIAVALPIVGALV